MNLDKWKSQIVRGTLEYCILLMLNRKTRYGYEILQELSKYPIIASTESTVYPLLRRLQKENFLQSTWQDSAEGLPPRKYYALTPEGEEYLNAMNEEWANLLSAMKDLKGEEIQ
ncbi:MAG TPA: PadR family transcriptional regulator [Candidatus Choladousia intestinigallinarum]|nr:PadR family transcriptional regulator [Candidatus Choladousia intestinigallinarum]